VKTTITQVLIAAITAGLVACSERHTSTPPAPAPAPAAPTPAAPPKATALTTPKPEPATTPTPKPPSPPPLTATPPSTGQNNTVATADEATRKWFISVERAKEIYDARQVEGRQVVFIDARTFYEFHHDGHIRGAMHYATNYTHGTPQPKVRNYLPGSAIVIYCHGEFCTDSIDVGRYFQSLKLDIGPIFIIKDGYPGWKKAFPNLTDVGDEVGFS